MNIDELIIRIITNPIVFGAIGSTTIVSTMYILPYIEHGTPIIIDNVFYVILIGSFIYLAFSLWFVRNYIPERFEGYK